MSGLTEHLWRFNEIMYVRGLPHRSNLQEWLDVTWNKFLYETVNNSLSILSYLPAKIRDLADLSGFTFKKVLFASCIFGSAGVFTKLLELFSQLHGPGPSCCGAQAKSLCGTGLASSSAWDLPIEERNPCLLHWQVGFVTTCHQERLVLLFKNTCFMLKSTFRNS